MTQEHDVADFRFEEGREDQHISRPEPGSHADAAKPKRDRATVSQRAREELRGGVRRASVGGLGLHRGGGLVQLTCQAPTFGVCINYLFAIVCKIYGRMANGLWPTSWVEPPSRFRGPAAFRGTARRAPAPLERGANGLVARAMTFIAEPIAVAVGLEGAGRMWVFHDTPYVKKRFETPRVQGPISWQLRCGGVGNPLHPVSPNDPALEGRLIKLLLNKDLPSRLLLARRASTGTTVASFFVRAYPDR